LRAIAKDVITINNDIANVNADAELDALVGRYVRVALVHAALNIDSATYSIDDTNELH